MIEALLLYIALMFTAKQIFGIYLNVTDLTNS
jgi:hypothetical protein